MYRLLIVDESPESAQAAAEALEWEACGVTELDIAGSFDQALALALERKPHLALVNFRLGQRMGCDLVSDLRAHGLKTAVCMVAREADPEQIRQAMRSGARDYLLQPLDPGELRGFLERTIHLEPEPQGLQKDPVLGVSCAALSKLTNKLLGIVRHHYASPQSLAAIAMELDMSSKYIGRVFLRETGMKFSEYLMAYRMLEARKRILGTREKISAIAASVGYVQMNNFYIHFKQYFGVSPSAMRNSQAAGDLDSRTGEPYEDLV